MLLLRYRSSQVGQYQIFPNLHSFSNHLTTHEHLLRSYLVPDVLPGQLLGPNSDFSFVAGDFEEVYGGRSDDGRWGDIPADQAGQWGAVVTCFFLDTARNIINYLKIIKGLLRPDGVWVNVGPLLWHWENVQDKERGEGSIELSLDEVKDLARKMGFEINVRIVLMSNDVRVRKLTGAIVLTEREARPGDIYGRSRHYAAIRIPGKLELDSSLLFIGTLEERPNVAVTDRLLDSNSDRNLIRS